MSFNNFKGFNVLSSSYRNTGSLINSNLNSIKGNSNFLASKANSKNNSIVSLKNTNTDRKVRESINSQKLVI